MNTNTFEKLTIVLGARLPRDNLGRFETDKKGRPIWEMPKPIHYAPHWMNPKKKAEALSKGLDVMTAGVGYTIHVPVYRGVDISVLKSLRSGVRPRKRAEQNMSRNKTAELAAQYGGRPGNADLEI